MRTLIADAGHESQELAEIKRRQGWRIMTVKCSELAFVLGLRESRSVLSRPC